MELNKVRAEAECGSTGNLEHSNLVCLLFQYSPRARRGQLSSAISNPPHYNLLSQAHRNQVLNPLSVAINGLRFATEAICDHVPRTVLDDLTMVSESLQHVEGRIADVFTFHKCITGEMGEPPPLLLERLYDESTMCCACNQYRLFGGDCC